MVDDIDIGGISPPQDQAEGPVDLSGLTESELEVHVCDLLASVGHNQGGPSGGLASLTAVWVISKIEKTCGVGHFVNPKKLTKDDLATPAALSRLLHREIRKQNLPLFGP